MRTEGNIISLLYTNCLLFIACLHTSHFRMYSIVHVHTTLITHADEIYFGTNGTCVRMFLYVFLNND